MNDFVKRSLAIKELYPNVTFNTPTKALADGIEVTINETSIASKIVEMDTARETEATAKANAQVSGNTKLLALGLTQAEATALTGYTPE